VSQVTAIILHIAGAKKEEFEHLFREEEMPIWQDFVARGKFIQASLSPVEGGSEEREGIQDYILHVELRGMAEHSEHDRDPRFKAFLDKARKLEPDPPLVYFGTPVFQVP
jgi:hypothetical protein